MQATYYQWDDLRWEAHAAHFIMLVDFAGFFLFQVPKRWTECDSFGDWSMYNICDIWAIYVYVVQKPYIYMYTLNIIYIYMGK